MSWRVAGSAGGRGAAPCVLYVRHGAARAGAAARPELRGGIPQLSPDGEVTYRSPRGRDGHSQWRRPGLAGRAANNTADFTTYAIDVS